MWFGDWPYHIPCPRGEALSIRSVLVLVLLASATAAQDRGPPPRELDRHGYSLPPGSIARIGTPPALTGFASSLAWSADGKQFVAADWDGVTVFDAESGRRIASFPGATDAKNVSAPLMRDGRTLLRLNGSAGSLVDIQSGETLHAFTLPSPLGDSGRRLYSLNVSANHRFLAGIASESSAPGVAWRYDLARNRFTRLINDRADLQSMRLAPDGKRVYATGGTSDPELTARAIGSDKEHWTVPLKGSGTLRAISADGKRLVVSDLGGLSVFDSADGKRVMTTAIESTSPPGVWGIDLSPDGKLLALADGDQVLVWDTATSKVLHRFAHAARLASFSPDGRSLVTASAWVQRWDLLTGKPVLAPSLLDRPDGAELLTWSRDGQKLLSVWPGARTVGGGQRRPDVLAVWNVSNARCDWKLHHDERVLAASVGRDGTTIRAYVEGSLIRTWDVRETSKATVAQMYIQPISTQHTAITFLPDDRFAMLSQNGQGSALDVYDAFGKPFRRRTRAMPEEPFQRRPTLQYRGQGTVTFGPGGWRFDLMTNREMPPLQQSLTFRVINLLKTDSGAVVAGRTIDQTAVEGHVWESLTGRVIAGLPTDIPNSDRAVISGDSRFLAISSDKQVTLYDFANPAKPIQLPIAGTTALAFSPDVSRIATAQNDGTILVWNVPRVSSPWQAADVERIWKSLEADAPTAWKTIWHLLDHPGPATEFMKSRLHPEPRLTDTAEQIARLDHSKYLVREQAMKELAGRGEIIEGDLLAAINAPRSEEQRARIQLLLSKINPAVPPSGLMLRSLRCVWVLERLGTPEAIAHLKDIARGASGSRVTTESKAALERLAASR